MFAKKDPYRFADVGCCTLHFSSVTGLPAPEATACIILMCPCFLNQRFQRFLATSSETCPKPEASHTFLIMLV